MKIKIRVVKRNGKPVFKYEDILFISLQAYDDFYGGKLKVLRKNKVIDTTSKIDEYGTHAPSMVFYGLYSLTRQYLHFSLEPMLFQENDMLAIEFPIVGSETPADVLERWVSSLQKVRLGR